MSTDFKELFEYFDQQFVEFKDRMGSLESGYRTLPASADNYAMRVDNYHASQAILLLGRLQPF